MALAQIQPEVVLGTAPAALPKDELGVLSEVLSAKLPQVRLEVLLLVALLAVLLNVLLAELVECLPMIVQLVCLAMAPNILVLVVLL